MEKNTSITKKLLVVTILLMVVAVSIIAFVGIYTKNVNMLSNIVPDYTFSTEFEGNKEYKFELDESEEEKEVYLDKDGNISGEVKTDTDSENEEVANTTEGKDIEGYTRETRTIKANEDTVLNEESYKKTRSIIENRLQKLGVAQFNTRLDEDTGKLFVELPDDEDADFLNEAISSKGEFQIIDSENGLKLMDNSHIKQAGTTYNESNGSYTVYLTIQFNKEGTEILKNISNKYIKTETQDVTVTENEENETAEASDDTTETIKYIEIQVDGTSLMKTYFGEEMPGGYIQIPLSSSITNVTELRNSIKSANAIATLLNTGNTPNAYKLQSDNFYLSTISKNNIKTVKIAFLIVLVLMAVIYIIKFRLNGLLAAILNFGYVALVSLAIRYTGVIVTISSIITSLGIIIIGFITNYMILNNLKNNKKARVAFSEAMKTIYLSIIPVCICAFVFTFMTNSVVTGIGMILFWGLIIHCLYNMIITRSVYVLNEK